MTIDKNLFNQERESFIASYFDGVNSMMGFDNVTGFDTSRFYRITDIAFELANFGTMDECFAYDPGDLVAFVETMEIMIPAVGYNMNIEQSYPNLMKTINCLGLYLSLYILEGNSMSEYCEITKDAIAAVLGVKLSTLRNMVSFKALDNMNNEQLREFLEGEERFKPFKTYNSLTLEAPFDLTNIGCYGKLINAIEVRAEKYNKIDELYEIYAKLGLTRDSSSTFKFVTLFTESRPIVLKFVKILKQINIVETSLKTGVEAATQKLIDELKRSGTLLNFKPKDSTPTKKSPEKNELNPVNFARPDVPYTSDNLGQYLKAELGFSTHQNDRGKNTKLFAVQKNTLSLAIERTKTPSVWMTKSRAEKLPANLFDITWYERSSDGSGRHSGLHTYSEFHTAEVAKVKVKSFEQAKQMVEYIS